MREGCCDDDDICAGTHADDGDDTDADTIEIEEDDVDGKDGYVGDADVCCVWC